MLFPGICLPDCTEDDEYLPAAVIAQMQRDRKKRSFKISSKQVPTTKAEFGWEFLRRNPAYQADYARLFDVAHQEWVSDIYLGALGLNIFRHNYSAPDSCENLDPINDEPPPSILFHADLYRTLEKWGLGHYLLDPAQEIHTTIPLDAVKRLGNNYYPARNVVHVPSLDGTEQESIPVDGGINPSQNKLAHWRKAAYKLRDLDYRNLL